MPIIRYKKHLIMKINLLKPLERIPYFTITGFKQVLDSDESDTQRVRETLSRWVNNGHIIRLKKGVYMTRRFYERHQSHASFLPAVSSIISPQSYLSLEYVLQLESVLTDITYPITAVTPKNTRTIENVLGTFTYRHIKLSLYTGFNQEEFFGVYFNRASVAKALFDYLYYRPLPRKLQKLGVNLAEELRLNLEEFSSEMKDEFKDFIELSESPKMSYIYKNFRSTVWQP